MKKALLTISLLMIVCKITSAQDPQFIQFKNVPLYLNPALTGEDQTLRFNSAYRNQWPGVPGSFISYYHAADYYVQPIRASAGFYFLSDQAGDGTLVNNEYAHTFSKSFLMKNDWLLTSGIKLSYNTFEVDWSKMTFGDQIDPRRGFVYSGSEERRDVYTYWDYSAGIQLRNNNFYSGAALHHISEPEILYDDVLHSPLPMKFNMNAGYRFKEVWLDKLTLDPMVIYIQQADFRQLVFNLNLKYDWLKLGMAYRNQDSFMAAIGFENDFMEISGSYDVTVSKLTNENAGSMELAILVRPFHYSKNKED